MIIIINCGGSGSRLWPMSTPEYPKHLLTIGGRNSKSLLQNTYDRAKKISNDIYFITESGHSDEVKDQLPDVSDDQIIIEPARRGTASCLLLALDRIGEKHDKDEALMFMHADHVIHDVESFAVAVEHATSTALKEDAITLLGVEPTYASTGFGYIERGQRMSDKGSKDVHEVASFKEKPDRETAQQYIEDGSYLWNMGYFAASVNTFVRTMKDSSPKLLEGYDLLCSASGEEEKNEKYLDLEDIAIDYALIEPAEDLVVVPGNFDWMDVGNFKDLHSVASQDDDGNYLGGDNVEAEGVTNSYVKNSSNLPVGVIGLDNVAVVATDNGIIVTNINHAHKVGDVSKKLRKGKS